MNLSIYLSLYLPIYLSLSLSLSFSLSISLSISLSLYLSLCLSLSLSICLYASLKTKRFCETSSVFELGNIKNAAIQREAFIFWTWQPPKRSNSARLLQFLNLKTSKTKQFCETSFKNGKLSAELTASYQCVLRFFQSTCLKYCACHEKIDARSYEVLHLSRKIILAKPTHPDTPKRNPSGNQRPDLLTSLMNMSFVLRRPRKMHLCRSSSNVPCLPSFLEILQNPHALLTFEEVHNPLRLPRETTSEPPKVVRTPSVFNMLTSKCALRHNGVHFFDIATSKSGLNLVFFVHFDLEMCFAPQRRTLFRHLNFQKWSEHGVLCTFWLGNVLRATTACTFSTSQLPKMVREWYVLYILTSKCASRHNGVQFFISHLASWLRTRRVRSQKSLEKHSVSRLSYLFAHLHLLSSDSFSSLIFSLLIFLFSLPLPCSAFHLSILSEVWLLNFLRLTLVVRRWEFWFFPALWSIEVAVPFFYLAGWLVNMAGWLVGRGAPGTMYT